MIYTTVQDLKGDISKVLKDNSFSLPLNLKIKKTPFISDKYKQEKAIGVYHNKDLVGYLADGKKFLLARNHKNCEEVFNLMGRKDDEVDITITRLDTNIGHPRYWSYIKDLGFYYNILIKGDARKYTRVRHLFKKIEELKKSGERVKVEVEDKDGRLYIYDRLDIYGEIVTKVPYNIKRALLRGERELFLDSYKQEGDNFEIEGTIL